MYYLMLKNHCHDQNNNIFAIREAFNKTIVYYNTNKKECDPNRSVTTSYPRICILKIQLPIAKMGCMCAGARARNLIARSAARAPLIALL